MTDVVAQPPEITSSRRPRSGSSAPHPDPSQVAARRRCKAQDALTGLGFAAPALVVFAVFMFVPLVLTFYLSLRRYRGFGRSTFIGAKNYSDMLHDPTFWHAVVNTSAYTAITVPLGLAGGLAAAMLLNKAMPARGLWRALFYVPVVISSVASAVIASWMFNEDFGIVNRVLRLVGVGPVQWQSSGGAAMASLVITSLWVGVGFTMVVYLAGLQGIPGETYEAARMDGATGLTSFRYITWPLLGPTTFFLLVYNIIISFQVFDLVYVLTGGGPGDSTTMLVTYAYSEGFEQRRQGYAAAIGVVLYVVVLALTAVQWRLSKARDEA